MKKTYYIILVISLMLIFFSLNFFIQKNKSVEVEEKNTIPEVNNTSNDSEDNSSDSDVSEEKKIDIDNTVVVCKNGNEYSGEDLKNKKINFSLISNRIFYKGEELERLCNPGLKEYDFDSEQSYRILPAYIKTK